MSRYKLKRVRNFLDDKLHIDWSRGGKELKGWYWLDGKKTLTVYMPHQHGGRAGDDLSHTVLKNLRSNLKLSSPEFDNLYECPMTGSDYEAIIRDKNIA
jgi:hypothetical protein